MSPKTLHDAARIVAEIRRLRHVLERRKLTRTQAALVAAQREIEALRAQLQALAAPLPTTAPEPETDR